MNPGITALWQFRIQALSDAQRQLAQRLEPVLHTLSSLPPQEKFLIAIDGPCGSGKTTLAHLLSFLLDAFCIHMDDYHIPLVQKTDARLSLPGGNSDRERLLQELIIPWKNGSTPIYRPYDCALDKFAEPVVIPRCKLLVLEGSYSHHPELAAYTDVQFFVHVGREEQLRRIEHRCPEKLPMFLQRWIPLEDSYFAAFDLPAKDTLIIYNDSVQGM